MKAENKKQAQPTALQLKRASNAAMASILNLTLMPVISFIALLIIYQKTQPGTIDRYHAALGVKINIIAALALFLVSALMILLGGFDSPWTWVYVISYFTLVHTGFIIVALWALVRSWSGDRLKSTEPLS
jgi:protein-S-isoprenylcysteine O-methyltransferase Ste14